MRRRFLFQMIAGGIGSVSGGSRSLAADTEAILGDWHMLGTADDEIHVPQHRLDLRFKSVSGELKGAILNRNDRTEIPLASSEFDGSTLRFHDGGSQRQSPNRDAHDGDDQ